MGRENKRKKRARRDQRRRRAYPRTPEAARYSSVGEAILDGTIVEQPEAAQSTAVFLITAHTATAKEDPDGPACGGPLLIHADGAFQCTAGCPGGTAVLHLPEALHFCHYADRLGIDADELGHVCQACTAAGASEAGSMFSACTGIELDHRDGTTSCSLGDSCHEKDAPHAAGQTCGLMEPCERCGIFAPMLA